MAESTTTIFGIRHHGPGSARSLLRALEALQPDCILVEGPPDGDAMIPHLAGDTLQPPVALLVYAPAQSEHSVFYPFAEFSPEFNALKYAVSHGVPVRFMDLAQAHRFALADAERASEQTNLDAEAEAGDGEDEGDEDTTADREGDAQVPGESGVPCSPRQDPLGWLARAAGYGDGEEWWEEMVERRADAAGIFEAVLEAMRVMREEAEAEEGFAPNLEEQQREASMRQIIRGAQKEGHKNIAVICGAWHAPALHAMPPIKHDTALLKGLPKIKTESTWIPWTYNRLSVASGYGAGVRSPGWYEYLWQTAEVHDAAVSAGWLTRVARLLREADLDCSSAHVIESVRLAEAIAAMRERPRPGLNELNEAVLTCVCMGDTMPLRLIEQKLIVGDRLGEVGEDLPQVPLQRDITALQKSLRLKPEASRKVHDFDLRKPNDLERSHLLHRLRLLNIPWGEPQRNQVRTKGTFHEFWELEWKPEFAVAIIEGARWGNTVLEAASAATIDRARGSHSLQETARLIEAALLASLDAAIPQLLDIFNDRAAVSTNIPELMRSIPPLVNIVRYGNVRQTNVEVVGHVIDHSLTRICIGLSGACHALDDEAAGAMAGLLRELTQAIGLLEDEAGTNQWHAALASLIQAPSLHGLVAGAVVRILLDADELDGGEAARRMGLALSAANDPTVSAGWLEGFLKDSGVILLHDEKLWNALDQWVCGLTGDAFQVALPLVRRTFSTFQPSERHQMGQRVKHGGGPAAGTGAAAQIDADFNTRRADQLLPILAKYLGVES